MICLLDAENLISRFYNTVLFWSSKESHIKFNTLPNHTNSQQKGITANCY